MQRKPSSLRATNRVYVKRIVGLLVIALLVFWVFIDPDSAADTVQDIGSLLREGAESVITFFTSLV
ncbi:hypothetical protein K1T35_32050 [Pseudonocardia sp. DSM 110487]|jgi:hypothetical protein|nr:hypothetical protein K1T35_32050 [Pseudonocardia sp. DSM 110487]